MRHARGYTLIEVLVVVFIIAAFTTTVLLSFGLAPQDTTLERQADRLAALVELAGEEALIQGRDYGLRLEPQAYQFFVFDVFADQWIALDQDEMFRSRSLDEGLEFSLVLEEREVLLETPRRSNMSQVELAQPQIMLMSSGEFTPFELRLEREFTDEAFTLIGRADGTLELARDEP